MSEITPVTEWPDYATNPQGGDPFTQDLNAPYDKVSNRDIQRIAIASYKKIGRYVLVARLHDSLLVSLTMLL